MPQFADEAAAFVAWRDAVWLYTHREVANTKGIPMNRAAFYASLRQRSSGVFGTSLSQQQVIGTEAILDACLRHGVTDPHHVANVLAQVYHETGGHMLGIKETVYASHKDKNPSDAAVIKRLDAAWAKGQLGSVRTPYWRDGWFGRGPIQITHRDNYVKFERILGVPLTKNPALALDPKIGADIAVIGMRDGVFRNLRLSQYTFPRDLANPQGTNPRRIVNGNDGTDAKVAGYHRAFLKALSDAGYSGKSASPAPIEPSPDPTPSPKPSTPPAPKQGDFWSWLKSILNRMIGRN